MNKLQIYTIFGIMFLSSILLGNGLYSNSFSVFAQENEAEIEADIEQENKCTKDTECENENEIDNKLTIKNIIKQSDNQAPEDQEIGIMYVTNEIDGTVSVIDTSTNTVVGLPIPVGNVPQGIAFDSQNNRMYVANEEDDTVSVIDTSTNTVVGLPIPVGESPRGIAFALIPST